MDTEGIRYGLSMTFSFSLNLVSVLSNVPRHARRSKNSIIEESEHMVAIIKFSRNHP